MKKSSLLLSMALASVMTASAVQLSPDAAMQRVQKQCPQMAKAPGAASWQLGHTFMRPGQPTVPAMYIFTTVKDGGYLILAADDAVAPVIGYSDTGTIDPANMPPALQWWLEGCALTIEQTSHILLYNKTYSETDDIDDIDPIEPVEPNDPDEPSDPNDPDKPGDPEEPEADWAPVDPIVKTQWGQDFPYNQQCPEINGRRTYTGCVATAMSQVAKVHQWPVTGTGYLEYEFNYDDKVYTDSFDFGATTFGWEAMNDFYYANSSPESCEAVATLMHACGVAAEMQYGLYGSGANDFVAARGMVKYLDYDKGLKWLRRNWFTGDEWAKTIYDEIAQGRPVMMGATTFIGEGHEFIIDGYSSDCFFHINWGWEGMSDGYFLITALNPTEQGVGGSSDTNGYNYNQSILVGVQPPVEGSDYAPVIYNSYFYTTLPSYKRGKGAEIKFTCDLGNRSLETMTCEFGLKLVAEDGDSTVYVPWGKCTLDPTYYIPHLQVPTTSLPEGKWTVTPVYRIEENEWSEMYYDHFSDHTEANIDVRADVIYVEGVPASLSGKMLSIEPVDGTDTAVMNGKSYNVTYDVTSTGLWQGTLYCLLASQGNVVATATKDIQFNDATTITETWTIDIPADLKPGKYPLYLATLSGMQYMFFVLDYVTIEQNPEVTVAGELVSAEWVEADDIDQKYTPGNAYTFNFDLTTDGPCELIDVILAIIDHGSIVEYSDMKNIKFEGAETVRESFNMFFPESMAPGVYDMYLMKRDAGSTFISIASPWPLTLTEIEGISSVLTDPGAIRYYDLQGVPVTTPLPGGIYIRVTPDKAVKVKK